MEVFSHINELGHDGWPGLRSLVLGFSQVLLWAASASYLNESRQSDPTLPTPDELLWYIRNGHIQIMARDWWIDQSKRRAEHPWPHARNWIDSFDGEVHTMWLQDQRAGRYGRDARVLAFGEETGQAWAQGFAQDNKIDLADLAHRVSDLPGYAEKAARAGDGMAGGLSILRDAYNHGQGFALSGANRNLGTPKDEKIMHILQSAAKADFPPCQTIYNTSLSIDRVLGVVSEIIGTIEEAGKPCQDQEDAFQRTKGILSKPKLLSEYRDWIKTCDQVAASVHENYLATELAVALADDIQKHSHPTEVKDFFLPRDKMGMAKTIGSAGLAAIAVKLGAITAPFSIGLLSLTPGTAALRKIGWIPEQYNGPRWPFYFADGTTSVRRQSREKMLQALRR